MATQKNDDIDTNHLSILHSNLNPPQTEHNEENSSLPSPPSHHHHHLSSINATIIIRNLPSQGLSFQIWPAAFSFISFLNLNPFLLLPSSSSSPLRIIELGSGTGLLGIAASAILSAHVTLTDLPHVLPNLQFNAIANAGVVAANAGKLAVKQLRWGVEEDIAAIGLENSGFDAVIASDVVYYDHLIRPLIETIRVLVKGEKGFLMAHLRRWKKRDAVFFRRAKRFFDVSVVHADPPVAGERKGVIIYRFLARRRSPDVMNM